MKNYAAKNYNLAIANDHAGFELKIAIEKHLNQQDIDVLNLGTDNTEPVDYPDFARKLTRELIYNKIDKGILICATGIGMSIAANRRPEIRAALCVNEFMAERARAHNDANVLVLGSKLLATDTALRIVDIFLRTSFAGARHSARLAKIE